MAYCSSTLRRSWNELLARAQGGRTLSSGRKSVGLVRVAYLKPVGNFSVDFVDALDSLIEDLYGLLWLQCRLESQREVID